MENKLKLNAHVKKFITLGLVYETVAQHPFYDPRMQEPVNIGSKLNFNLSSLGAVVAVFAVWVWLGELVAHQAVVRVVQGVLDPRVVARVREHGDIKFQFAIKGFTVGAAVGVDKVAGVGNWEAALPEQPLVDFHLALVAFFPLVIKVDLPGFARGFVVNHNELAGRVDPQVVDGAGDQEVGWLVMVLDAFEVLAPLVEQLVSIRNGVDTVFFHERVRFAFGAVDVEFFFEERVDRGVQIKRRHRGLANAQAAVKIKTAGAALEILYFRARQFERRFCGWVKQISDAGFGHR